MGSTTRVWEQVREVGGSIIGPDGENLTAAADGADAFEYALKELTGNRPGLLHWVLNMMKGTVEDAKKLKRFNRLPLTNPKCYSKPIFHLKFGANVDVQWVKGGPDEEPCDR